MTIAEIVVMCNRLLFRGFEKHLLMKYFSFNRNIVGCLCVVNAVTRGKRCQSRVATTASTVDRLCVGLSVICQTGSQRKSDEEDAICS